MKISDKQLGYITIFTIISIIIIIAGAMIVKDMKASYKIRVEFDNLGALQIQDPVTIKGFEVGQVIDTYWENGKSIIVIKFYQPVTLHENCLIKNVNYSMMGGRKIDIIDDKTQKMLDLRKNPLFEGYFEPGISETMHLIVDIKEQLNFFKELLIALRNGKIATDSTNAKPSLSHQVWDVINKSDKTIADASEGIINLNKQLNRIFASLDKITGDINQAVVTTDTTLKTIYTQAGSGFKSLDKQIVSLNGTLVSLNNFLISIQDDALYDKLLEKKDLITQIDSIASTIEAIVAFAASDGMYVKDSVGNKSPLLTLKNFKFFQKQSNKERNQKKE